MKLAIIGTRGVPANYGGFETFAEELGWRLAERGHEVTVYGRRGLIDPNLREYRGMRLVVLPSLRSKHLETVSNTFVAALHATRHGFDAALVCNAANAPFVRILQLAGIPVVSGIVNAANRNSGFRKMLESSFGVSADAVVPSYHSKTMRKTLKSSSG